MLILFLCTLSQLSMAQNTQPWLEKRISISVQNKAVEEVLKVLEGDLSGMVFAYLPGSFDVSKKVSVKLDSVTLREVLQQVFADQSIDYSEMRGKIFLKKKKEEPGKKSDNLENPVPNRRRKTVGGSASTSATQGGETRIKAGQNEDKEAKATKVESRPLGDASNSARGKADESEEDPAQRDTQQTQSRLASSEAISNNSVEKASGLASENIGSKAPDPAEQMPLVKAQVPELLQVKWSGNNWIDYQSVSQPYLPPLPIAFTAVEAKKSFWSWLKMPTFLTKNPDKPAKEKKVGSSVEEPDAFKSKGLRFYLATTVGISPLGSENSLKLGGRLVWQKNPSLGFGLGGYAVVGTSTTLPGQTERYRIAGGYGGFHMEYTLNPFGPVHVSFPILIGLGEITYIEAALGGVPPGITEDGTRNVMVLEPGAMLEMNVFKFMKLGLNVTYRYTSNSEIKYSNGDIILESTGLNGIAAGITIKIGRF